MTLQRLSAALLVLAALTLNALAQGTTPNSNGPAATTAPKAELPTTIKITAEETAQVKVKQDAHTIRDQAAQIAKLTTDKAIKDFNEATADAQRLFNDLTAYVSKVTGIPVPDLPHWTFAEVEGQLVFTRRANAPPRLTSAPAPPPPTENKPKP